jgi:hypothetical protein
MSLSSAAGKPYSWSTRLLIWLGSKLSSHDRARDTTEPGGTDSIQMQSGLNCLPLIDIKRQKVAFAADSHRPDRLPRRRHYWIRRSQICRGERQGASIGRATHCNADLIVLDEPKTTSRRG